MPAMKTFLQKGLFGLFFLLSCGCFSISATAQTTVISGTVADRQTGDPLPAASVLLKGTGKGTVTNGNGHFSIPYNGSGPVTLVVSSVGYAEMEFSVNAPGDAGTLPLEPTSAAGTEVIVSATRGRIRSLESPVSVERVGAAQIKETAGPSFYDALANLKGVDAVTSSILFKSLGTRGFNGSGNVRMNQLVDGMDNQAPGLNFAVGNIVGLNELDVDNVELLPGASSALYGSGGMTGTLLMTSKDPFRYQGLSVQLKEGVNHINDANSKAELFHDFMFRYSKAFNNKFAFRVSAEFTKAKDWIPADERNFSPVQGKPIPGNSTLPNYNGINTYGDESTYFNTKDQLNKASQGYSAASLAAAAAGNAALAAQYAQLAAQSGALSGATPANSGVARTGYSEHALTNYQAYNVKASAGIFYRLTPNTTAGISGNFGSANTVYQGTDRYALRNVQIGQYKAEVTGRSFYVRAYTTQESAGDSYDMVAAATLLNETYAPTATVWAPNYLGAYAQAFGAALGAGQTNDQAYATASAAARQYADANRLIPGSAPFKKSLDSLKKLPIPSGGKFNDKTNLYAGEGMYNFSDLISWADITIGASTREFVLNSHGTIFADTAGKININETGAFLQIQKGFFHDVLKLTASGRYDKNSNFAGRFTPRFTGVVRLAKDQYLRASFQTAYRFPSTQNQYINLRTGSARLIGGLPQFIDAYGLRGTAYDTASLSGAASTGVAPTPYQFKEFKPESVASWEIGYKGLIAEKLLIDLYGFYARYTNFIGLTVLVKNPFTEGQTAQNTFGIYTNSSNKVNTIGAGISLEYALSNHYVLSGNFAYNKISNNDANVLTQFNTPNYKYNFGLANYSIAKVFGFSVTWRWQDKYKYESSFVSGNTPAFSTIDAQISMKIPKINSLLKVGGSNVLNKYYVDAIGNVRVGGIYYIGIGYNL